MVDFLEICERALNGSIMTETDFDLSVFVPKLRQVIERYDIRYDPNTPVPSDDELADRVFQAAVEFFSEIGVYCQDTNRVIRFSRDEIEEGITEPPPPCRVGEGKEAKIFLPRRPEDGSLPWCHIGSGIVASTEEIMTNLVEAYGSIRPSRLSPGDLCGHPINQIGTRGPEAVWPSRVAHHEFDIIGCVRRRDDSSKQSIIRPSAHRWLVSRDYIRDEGRFRRAEQSCIPA